MATTDAVLVADVIARTIAEDQGVDAVLAALLDPTGKDADPVHRMLHDALPFFLVSEEDQELALNLALEGLSIALQRWVARVSQISEEPLEVP